MVFENWSNLSKEQPFSGNKERNFVFQENETYNLRSGNHSAQRNIRTTQFESVKVLHVWEVKYGT